MIEHRPTAVDDPVARQLLDEYFDYRAATFPQPDGYRRSYPSAAAFTPPEGVFLTVLTDDAVAGCGGVRRLSPVRYEVKHLWIRPALQGQGLGRGLLAELERRAAELGATEVVLDTNASLEAAGGLYRSSGYQDVAPYNDNPNATNWYRKALQ
ncbi:MAG TPA: GNAT family N-acetyltransferase [Rhodoglobus sp.]|nr:GNAT family N-acetyltransferase [Rhodoglobus sp.]